MLNTSTAMLCLEQVSKCFDGGIQALHQTTLKFYKGQFAVLLGPSGAGKSTLLRCLNFLNVPTTGQIRVDKLGTLNGNCRRLRRHRHQTAMVFQQHQLIGRHTALQNILIGRIGNYSAWRSLWPLPHKDHHLALECLERVGLLDKANERVDNLSGGQKQRVGIARGLAQQPKIILADEPVASLDPATSEKILSMLHRICREDDLTAIVSLHQVELAKMFGDRIIALADGKVVFDGEAEQITDSVYQRIYHGCDGPDSKQCRIAACG
ncbi:MAG: phosphonate ABC transporter ATP-binding protein [Desulfobacteraceae bacterium]|jgi:phosphonate transport system ATP-binding protein